MIFKVKIWIICFVMWGRYYGKSYRESAEDLHTSSASLSKMRWWESTARGVGTYWLSENSGKRKSRSKMTYAFFQKTKIEGRGKMHLRLKATLDNVIQKEAAAEDLAWLSVFQLSALIWDTEKLWKLKNSQTHSACH